MGFDLKNIQAIFEESNNTTVLRNDVSNLVDAIPENCFDQSLDDADQAIVYSLSGYAAKNIIKSVQSCQDCINLLSPGKAAMNPVFESRVESNEDEIEAKEEFLRLITRGGLIKPSDALFIVCCHSWLLYHKIINSDTSKNLLLASNNSRATFIEVFIQKLDHNESSRKLLDIKCKKSIHLKTTSRKLLKQCLICLQKTSSATRIPLSTSLVKES